YRLADVEGPGRLDRTSYDLLASEARLSSFLAIAEGDVAKNHWFRLGRGFVSVDGRPTLISWSASMFEYLMPLLLMKTPPEPLLDQRCRNVVRRQIEYARSLGVPWGISESGFNWVDRSGHYQYRAFGVPGLGLKRGLGDDIVISPYSTMLAAMIDPVPAAKNLRELARTGMLGPYGFYEALDYSSRRRMEEAGEPGPPVREPGDSPDAPAIVRSFLAHHQGMSLLALTNVLKDFVMVRRFHCDPRVQA